jgi:hypothetical protein
MSDQAVDIQAELSLARAEAASGECPYAELMATYVELGELLESDLPDDELIEGSADLAAQLVALDAEVVQSSDQRWAVWMTRNTAMGGDVEQ